MARRIYLDNAATSFPKPESVYQAVDHYQRELGTAVGRGATRAAAQVQRTVDHCRLLAARLFGAPHPQQVVFTFNGTDALNLSIQGVLNPGDRALATTWDHNSVWRPLRELQSRGTIQTDLIPDDGQGQLDLPALARLLQTPTRLVVLPHASNVTGIVQPVQAAARLAHAAGALVLLDAAQTAGHLDVTFSDLEVDMIACPGHKGLLGPLGTGLLILTSEVASQLRPIRFGGTGTLSESDRQPQHLPDRYESGNLNAPGLFGLAAALQWHEQQARHASPTSAPLVRQLISGLRQLPHVQVHCGADELPRVDLVSITLAQLAPQIAASLLDEHFQIETRAGLHCSPLSHQALGTFDNGGTLRLSLGPFTTADDIDFTLESLAQIVTAI